MNSEQMFSISTETANYKSASTEVPEKTCYATCGVFTYRDNSTVNDIRPNGSFTRGEKVLDDLDISCYFRWANW